MKIFKTAGLTDVGNKRVLNEDHYQIDNDLGVLIVADGMGGHEAGEVASREATKIIHNYLKGSKQLYLDFVRRVVGDNPGDNETWSNLPNPLLAVVEEATQVANSTINNMNRDKGFSDNQGMGTTVVGIWLLEQLEIAVIFHVGDSRLYLLRNNCLGQLTVDHSLHQLWLDNGQIGPEPPKNIILAGVGLRETVKVDTRLLSIQANDVFLLCSDGLSDMVEEESIAVLLKKVTSTSIDDVCSELVDRANESGGVDNITASLAFLGE